MPIPLPGGVKLEMGETTVKVTGPKGSVTCPVPPGIKCKLDGEVLTVQRSDDSRQQRALHGLTRALIANGVRGTSTGFDRALEIHGVGYRAEVKGKNLELALGYSHPVVFPIPAGVSISVDKQTKMVVSGIDKQQVGQVAANIRRLRPPEPYKGKGIRYADETIQKKAGKTGATGG
jgi:large subunit ribosomal protein L6